MSDPVNKADGVPRADEERLLHALVSRGFLTADEAQTARAGSEAGGSSDTLLARLVKGGLLTVGQAKRARKEMAALVGQQIPGYQLIEKLGQGATGVVYKARQMSMDRLVAVKILHPKLSADPSFLARLKREAHVAARLSHNNIVQAIDVGSAGPLHYFVMELVEGKTIRQELETGKIYEEKEAIEIVLQIAQALGHAARRGLVHRDVKPANIVLTAEGIAKLADLGMARTEADDADLRRSERGLSIGTPYYMSPEQVRAEEDIDTRADLYALGATFYHMVTGKPPFAGPDGESVYDAHLHKELTPPDHLNDSLSAGLGEVVEILMAKDRGQRYQTPEDLVLDLECLLVGDPPKLAHKRIGLGTMAALAQGEEEETYRGYRDGPPRAWIWIGALGALLILSALLNLVLLFRRGS